MKIQEFNINRVKVFGQEFEKQFGEMYNPETVDRLRRSIKENGLKVLPGRLIEDNGYDVEIPYGRHRLEAAKVEGLKTIKIAVCKWDDLRMMKESFHENSHSYHQQIEISRRGFCILRFREILTEIFKECDTFEDFLEKHPNVVSKLDLNKRGFDTIKGQMNISGYQGVGYRYIAKMLNDEWSHQTIKRDIEIAVERKRMFDPDIYEEEQAKTAEMEKEAEESFGSSNITDRKPEDTPSKETSEEAFNVSEEDLAPLTEEPEESAYTHNLPKKDPRADNALKARAEKKGKEIEMEKELKDITEILANNIEKLHTRFEHPTTGVLIPMLKLVEYKNVWIKMDKVEGFKEKFEAEIERIKTQIKKLMKLYMMIKTNSYKVNMTMADLEEIIKRGEGK